MAIRSLPRHPVAPNVKFAKPSHVSDVSVERQCATQGLARSLATAFTSQNPS